jgi:hypothetical protein
MDTTVEEEKPVVVVLEGEMNMERLPESKGESKTTYKSFKYVIIIKSQGRDLSKLKSKLNNLSGTSSKLQT